MSRKDVEPGENQITRLAGKVVGVSVGGLMSSMTSWLPLQKNSETGLGLTTVAHDNFQNLIGNFNFF